MASSWGKNFMWRNFLRVITMNEEVFIGTLFEKNQKLNFKKNYFLN